MRFVFFALLFMNLVYFAWANWIDAPRPAHVNEAIAHLPRLKLVDEVPPTERPQPPAAHKTSLGSTQSCLSVGPFADPASSAQAAELLQAKGLDPRPRTGKSQASGGYWVYVGGLGQGEADHALVALERNGITDALVMPDNGAAGRRLSLGLYSERARAERRAEAVRQSGLEAEIAERKLPGVLYWLDVTAPSGVDTVPLQDLRPRIGARIAVQPCSAPARPAEATAVNATTVLPVDEPATAGNPSLSAAVTPRLP